MISLPELELITQRVFGKETISIWQVNNATIRLELTDNSFIDVFQSFRDSTKFAFHAKIADKRIFRLDCFPERKYQRLKTFPWHFHKGSEEKVVASPFSRKKHTAILQFLKFIKDKAVSPLASPSQGGPSPKS